MGGKVAATSEAVRGATTDAWRTVLQEGKAKIISSATKWICFIGEILSRFVR
jgi:hypothetical protein